MYEWRAKTQKILSALAGWFEYAHKKFLSESDDLMIFLQSVGYMAKSADPNQTLLWAIWGGSTWLAQARGYKTFFMLNSAEHENFSAIKLLLAFSYLLAEKFSYSAMLSKKNLQLLVIWDLLAELSMKKLL